MRKKVRATAAAALFAGAAGWGPLALYTAKGDGPLPADDPQLNISAPPPPGGLPILHVPPGLSSSSAVTPVPAPTSAPASVPLMTPMIPVPTRGAPMMTAPPPYPLSAPPSYSYHLPAQVCPPGYQYMDVYGSRGAQQLYDTATGGISSGTPVFGGRYAGQPMRVESFPSQPGGAPSSPYSYPGAMPPSYPGAGAGMAAPGSPGMSSGMPGGAPSAPSYPSSAGTDSGMGAGAGMGMGSSGAAPSAAPSGDFGGGAGAAPSAPSAAPSPSPAADAGAGAGAGAGAAQGAADAGASSGAQGGLARAEGAAPMIGDQAPFNQIRFPPIPGPLPLPGRPNNALDEQFQSAALMVRQTSLKISDNQYPRPVTRFFYSFNYFDDFNGDFNRRNRIPLSNVQVYHHLIGLELANDDATASIGLRLPIDHLRFSNAGVTQKTQANLGNLNLYGKMVLYENPMNGDVLTAGLSLNLPTSAGRFAGSRIFPYFNSTTIQPFLGYVLNLDENWYIQGFTSFDFPTDERAARVFFQDIALGYKMYQSADPNEMISSITPTIEFHANIPLNHRGLSIDSISGTPDIVDMTIGTHFGIGSSTLLTVAYGRPLTGPNVFEHEIIAMMNIRLGSQRQSASAGGPPQTFWTPPSY